jgi:hypothetical protein
LKAMGLKKRRILREFAQIFRQFNFDITDRKRSAAKRGAR